LNNYYVKKFAVSFTVMVLFHSSTTHIKTL